MVQSVIEHVFSRTELFSKLSSRYIQYINISVSITLNISLTFDSSTITLLVLKDTKMTSLVISSIRRSSLKSLFGSQNPTSITYRTSPIRAIQRCNYLNTCINTIHNNNIDTRLPKTNSFNIIPHRHIYTPEALDLESIEHIKRVKSTLYVDARQRYCERIAEYLQKGETNLIVKDDLVNLIAFAESESDLDLIDKVAEVKKDENFVSGWGTAIARLYYKFNQIDRAYNNLKDTDRFGVFFHQIKTFQIVMTLLFDADRHDHVLEFYDMASNIFKIREGAPYKSNRLLSVIAFASLAKMNTPESLDRAEKMLYEDKSNNKFMSRVTSLVSYLALNQDKPSLALNLSAESFRTYMSTRELKTISLLKLNRHEDVIFHLRNIINRTPHKFKVILRSTCDYIEKNQDKIEDEKIRRELMELLVEIKENNLVDDVSLESLVFKKISAYEPRPEMSNIQRRRPTNLLN